MPVSAAGDSRLYSYNGIVLPAILELDPVSYPYRLIFDTFDGDIYSAYLASDGFEYSTSSMGGSGWFIAPVSDGRYSRLRDGVWNPPYVPLAFNVSVDTIKWANFDIYNQDGTLYLSASNPVPVYSSDGDSDLDYSGQLDGIQQGIGEIQDSVDDVGSKVDDIQDTLTETKEEITSLPGKIASAIIDGIKSLFVPSEEDLTEIKDEYENMLSEKLGFVWQGFDLLTTFVGDLQTSLESGEAYEFNFPGVKLPMQGEEFVLVPETPVSLDNDLMDILRPLVGTVVSMIAVIAFVNMTHDYVLAIVSGVSVYHFERRKE